MIRVNELILTQHDDDAWFVKCSYGGRENIGMPCGCFFRILDDAGVPAANMSHLSMVSPKYLKVWETHYATATRIGAMLYEAQTQSFRDKEKGTRVTAEVASMLLHGNDGDYPHLGANTLPSDYLEAVYIMKQSVCTKTDVLRYRKENNKSDDAQVNDAHKSPERKSFYGYGDTLLDSDVTVFGSLSVEAQRLKSQMETSLLASPLTRKHGELTTELEKETYAAIGTRFEEVRSEVLQRFVQIAKHRDLPAASVTSLKARVIEKINDLEIDLQSEFDNLRDEEEVSGSDDVESSPERPLKSSGNEDPKYVSPGRMRRHRGVLG